ncbi:MAG: MFS transporter [Acetobacteraceae bacterium]
MSHSALTDLPAFPISAEVETLRQSALRKNAWRLVPILLLAQIFNYIDRTSVGFAALTMNHDLGLSATQFGWGAGILFAGYCLFEVPSSLVQRRVGARRWLGRIMITWGLAAAATAFATGPQSFYVTRFLVGVAEAGFFPGTTFFLAAWFPAQYRTRVLAWLGIGVPLSSLIGAPVSGALLQMHGFLGVSGWQWMFILEGLPVCVIGVVTLFLLVDEPHQASWLTAAERNALLTMLQEETRDRPKKNLWAALGDPRVLVLTGITFAFTLGSYGVGIWLPQILKGHGLTNLSIGFVSAFPYLVTTVVMLIWARHVDRTGKKIANLAAACLLGAVGLALAVMFSAPALGFAAVTVALVGTICARTIFWTIPVRFLTGAAAAGGLAFINSVGAFGGFCGPFMMGWLKDATGSFSAGLVGMALVMGVSVLLTLSLFLLVREE